MRRLGAAVVGLALIGIGVVAVVEGSRSSAPPADPIDAVEVCDATEYEGCPARWEYLWADED